MDIKTIEAGGIKIAVICEDSPVITDEQSALDLMMTVNYETGSNCMVLNKEAITDDFFKLSSGLAGNILQKFINYHCKFAIVGDFSVYTSKPLKDFIYECNTGKDIFFVSSESEAVDKLTGAV